MRGFSNARHAEFYSMDFFSILHQIQPRGCNFASKELPSFMAGAVVLMSAILSQLVGSFVNPFHLLREMNGRTMIRTAAIIIIGLLCELASVSLQAMLHSVRKYFSGD